MDKLNTSTPHYWRGQEKTEIPVEDLNEKAEVKPFTLPGEYKVTEETKARIQKFIDEDKERTITERDGTKIKVDNFDKEIADETLMMDKIHAPEDMVEKLVKRYDEILDRLKKAAEANKKGDAYREKIGETEMLEEGYPIYKDDIEFLDSIRKWGWGKKLAAAAPGSDFNAIAGEICRIHERKNADYGDAAYESYKEFGIRSYVMRISDKYRRLKTLTTPGHEQLVKDESVEDTLIDLAAYSIMAVEALRKDRNKTE